MSILNTVASKWDSAKPTILGLAVGLVAGPLISGYMGWQVTSSAARTQLRAGIVEVQATICSARARVENAEANKLDWNARTTLARKWAVMPGGTAADPDVTTECSNKLAT